MRITIATWWVALCLCSGCATPPTPEGNTIKSAAAGQPPSATHAFLRLATTGSAGRVGLLDPITRCDTETDPAKEQAPSVQFLSGFHQKDAEHDTFPTMGTSMTMVPADDPVRVKLGSALAQAHIGFVRRLCKDVRYLFVQEDAGPADNFGGAYAFWQKKHLGAQPVRFISIPSGVFASQPDYGSYERDLINAVIQKAAANTTYALKSASAFIAGQLIDGQQQSRDLALLAIIAHEEGHIIAQRLLLRGGDAQHSCGNPDGKFFSDYTWKNLGSIPNFHYFGQTINASHLPGVGDPYPVTIATAPAATANRDMMKLYDENRNFVSLFAALAPDEDIAETYRFRALKKSKSNVNDDLAVTLTLPDTEQVEILSNVDLGSNGTKVNCIDKQEGTEDPPD
jgi:hypothetical protein